MAAFESRQMITYRTNLRIMARGWVLRLWQRYARLHKPGRLIKTPKEFQSGDPDQPAHCDIDGQLIGRNGYSCARTDYEFKTHQLYFDNRGRVWRHTIVTKIGEHLTLDIP